MQSVPAPTEEWRERVSKRACAILDRYRGMDSWQQAWTLAVAEIKTEDAQREAGS